MSLGFLLSGEVTSWTLFRSALGLENPDMPLTLWREGRPLWSPRSRGQGSLEMWPYESDCSSEALGRPRVGLGFTWTPWTLTGGPDLASDLTVSPPWAWGQWLVAPLHTLAPCLGLACTVHSVHRASRSCEQISRNS